ncbi:hypothetical protein LTR95_005335 [Oleoguttula sp. CCFEE 5521]
MQEPMPMMVVHLDRQLQLTSNSIITMGGFAGASFDSRNNADNYIRTNGDNYSLFNALDHYKTALPYEGQEYAPSVRDWASFASKKRSGNASSTSRDRPATTGPSIRVQPAAESIASRKQPVLPSMASEERSIPASATADREHAAPPITNKEQTITPGTGHERSIKEAATAEEQAVDNPGKSA